MDWLLLALCSLAASAAPEAASGLAAVPASGPGATLAQPGEEGRGQLVVVGEGVGPAVVTRVEVHPEFERLHLEAPGQVLPPVELVQRRLDREGICVHHGLTLFPRWELVGPVPEDPWHEGERAPATVEEQVHAALCAQLAARGEGIDLGRVVGAQAATPKPAPLRLLDLPDVTPPAGFLQPVVWLAAALSLGLALAGARRLDRAGWRDLALVAGLAAALRLGLARETVFNGALAGYEKLVFAFGQAQAPEIYGQGWRALLAPVVDLLGARPSTVLESHRLLAILSPVALWVALRPVSAGAARLGGLMLAALPLAVLLSATEEMLVPAVFLALLAAAGAAQAGSGARGLAAGALAGVAGGLLAHLRPEGLLVLPAIALIPWALRGRAALREGGTWAALLLGGGLVLLRLAELPALREGGPLRPQRLGEPAFLLRALVPTWQEHSNPMHLFMQAAWTSPVLWVGVAAALAGAWRAPRPLLPWLAWVLGTGVLLTKSWPLADAWRLQLLAMPGWVALAALGLAPRLRRPWLQELVVGLVALPLAWQRLDFARHQEWRWLARVVPTLPADAVLRVEELGGAAFPDRARLMGVVLVSMRPGLRLVAPTASSSASSSASPPQDGQLVLRGVACFERPVGPLDPAVAAAEGCMAAQRLCRLAPLHEVDVDPRSDLDGLIDPRWLQPDGRLRLGLYRLEGCRTEAVSDQPSAP